jgi:hypothetical protein
MVERDPWLSPRLQAEIERADRRHLFEIVMADVDRGELDLETAVAILALSDEVLDVTYDKDQLALFETEDGDASL